VELFAQGRPESAAAAGAASALYVLKCHAATLGWLAPPRACPSICHLCHFASASQQCARYVGQQCGPICRRQITSTHTHSLSVRRPQSIEQQVCDRVRIVSQAFA
jgi:hypothetical protein